MKAQYVVVWQSPHSMYVYGPFKDKESAEYYADTLPLADIRIKELHTPSPD